MRYSAAHKQETRDRILRTAAHHFRRRGGKGVAIAELMSTLNLTHGGFYKYFESKEQLLAEAIRNAFDETQRQLEEVVSRAKPGTELQTIIENYLTLEHCANPGEGCPMAALASDIGRLPKSVRSEIDRAIQRRVEQVSRFMPGSSVKERRTKTMALISGLIGSVNIARALTDQAARKAVLKASKDVYIKVFCN